jgi:hypothetical protein
VSEFSLLEKLILEEVSGKNQAIHAYDKILWTVRTGFLTLFFAGWGVLLKSLVETSFKEPVAQDNSNLLVMLLVSVALGVGGFIVDQNYAKRKFRVIYALDRLMMSVLERKGQCQQGLGDDEVFLQVAGDKNDDNYLKVSGYWREAAVSWTIYPMSIAIAAIAVVLIWK